MQYINIWYYCQRYFQIGWNIKCSSLRYEFRLTESKHIFANFFFTVARNGVSAPSSRDKVVHGARVY